uniref:Uncharacterized protein n=1 Tax=Peronospora matthiolae TaxID=2874970 RepID=A0AAV1TUV3_9STRA
MSARATRKSVDWHSTCRKQQAWKSTFRYPEAVGALIPAQATATRQTIAYAVGYVSRFMENPQQEHWTAVADLSFLARTKSRDSFQPSDKIDFRGTLGRGLGRRPR